MLQKAIRRHYYTASPPVLVAGRNAWRNYLTNITTLEADVNATGVPLNLLRGVADSITTILKTKVY